MSDFRSEIQGKDFQATLDVVKPNLDRNMANGTYAFGFALDVAMVTLTHRYNVFRITDEIAALEGLTGRTPCTKPATMFRGRHLYGYWHKHFTQAAYMARNIMEEMRRNRTIEQYLAPYIGQILTEEILGGLAHAIVHDNYLKRQTEKRLTGEWIVYSKAGGRNNYLTIASHSEEDAVVAARIKQYEEIDRRTGWRWDHRNILVDPGSMRTIKPAGPT